MSVRSTFGYHFPMARPWRGMRWVNETTVDAHRVIECIDGLNAAHI